MYQQSNKVKNIMWQPAESDFTQCCFKVVIYSNLLCFFLKNITLQKCYRKRNRVPKCRSQYLQKAHKVTEVVAATSSKMNVAPYGGHLQVRESVRLIRIQISDLPSFQETKPNYEAA